MSSQTLRFRQVHPAWIQKGRVTSQLFLPTPKDDDQLSVALEEKTSPEESYHTHVVKMGCKSAGVMAVSEAEVKGQELRVVPQPLEEPVPDPAHAYIDYESVESNGRKKRISKTLTNLARERDWLWAPSSSEREPAPQPGNPGEPENQGQGSNGAPPGA